MGDRQLAWHVSGAMQCRDGDGIVSWLYDVSFGCSVSFTFCSTYPCCRQAELAHQDNCRMLTEIPVKDCIGCPATPSSLSALVGAIVPGQLRKLETVFEVVGLQVLGISSVKTETDVWLIDSCAKCKKAAPCEAWTPAVLVRSSLIVFGICL